MKGIIYTVIGGIFWGLSGTASEYLIRYYNIPPLELSAFRMFFGGIILILISLKYYKTETIALIKNFKDMIVLIFFAIVGLMINQITYLFAIEHTNAGTATVFLYLAPILILIYECFIEKRLPKKREIIAFLFAITGVFFIATNGNFSSLSMTSIGLFFCLMSAITITLCNLLPLKLLEKYGPIVTISVASIFCGILEFICFKPYNLTINFDYKFMIAAVTVIIFGNIVAYVLYLDGVKRIGPTKASMISSVEPVAAAVCTMMLLGTSFTFIEIIGFFLVVSTIFILIDKK